MESDILTGKKLNEAKNKTTDEAVDAILKQAQEQLDRNMGGETKQESTAEEKRRAEQEKFKKKQEKLAEEARREQEKISREKAEKDRLAREKAEKDRLAKEKAEKDRLAKEKAEKDRLAKEKAEKDRLAKEKAEKDRLAKEKAEKDRLDKEKAEEAARIDILVDNKRQSGAKQVDKTMKESAAALDIEDEVIVDNSVPAPIRKEGVTVGDVIGGILEFLWTIFKLAVVISIVTAIVGFFLSREMLVRGRNGNLKSLDDMQISQTAMANKDSEDAEVKEWIKEAKPQKLTMESDDGYILVARQIIANKDGDKWVVLMHGYNGSMEDVYDIARRYVLAGYNVLMPDLRASGESEGSFIGMGWLDRLDVINWIDVIIAENPSADVILHGVDMGADTALMISGEPIKSNIKAIVAEGAYTSAWDALQKEFKLRHEKWPVFPMMEMINPVAKIWGGYTLREASTVKQVAKTSVPILLIQGGQDTYVTETMADELNQSIASSHELVVIPGGTHEYCRYADPDAYYNKVFDFVNAHAN